MRVKPADGRIVRDPLRGDDLPAEGRDVPRNVYWRRCVQAGDAIEIAETGDADAAAIAESAAADVPYAAPSGAAQGKATKGSKG
ncbi:hypothetical protein CUJ89_08655 [Burkholderia pyrrocinia]|uniref:DUF2635 domain-containing protein n=2 Tax=Burkholderia pyrrocinia TaxID=60550 RepID=A0A2Z5N0E5_BURPY|nr:hypothetical protein CUJ89_08655 [Burkholderia pyrrocinia]